MLKTEPPLDPPEYFEDDEEEVEESPCENCSQRSTFCRTECPII